MRAALLVFLLAVASSAPAPQLDNPDSDVELVQPVENDPITGEDGNDTETVVIKIGPGILEAASDVLGGFGIGSLAGSFGGFGERKPVSTKIDLGSLFENSKISLSDIFGSEDSSGISLSVSFEPKDEAPHGGFGQVGEEQDFNLKDFVKSFTSGNTQQTNSRVGGGNFGNRNSQTQFGGFDPRNFNPSYDSRNQNPNVFQTRNPGGFGFKKRDPVGFGQGNFNLGDILGGRNQQPQTVFKNPFGSNIFINKEPQFIPSGRFGGLTGLPWTSFRSIFDLYDRPEHRGYRAVFGPVLGHGGGSCGLCQLFPSESGPGVGSTVTIELIGQTPDYYDYQYQQPDYQYQQPDNDYQYVEEEPIPGGAVVRINDTTIKVIDESGNGVFFLLNTDPDVVDDDANEATDEDGTEGNVDSVTEVEPDVTTQYNIPEILDEGRFDIANDKLGVNTPDDNIKKENKPDTSTKNDYAQENSTPQYKVLKENITEENSSTDNTADDNTSEENITEYNTPEDNSSDGIKPEDTTPKITGNITPEDNTTEIKVPEDITEEVNTTEEINSKGTPNDNTKSDIKDSPTLSIDEGLL